MEKKEFRQYGAYGIIIKDDKILLIKKMENHMMES
ncbi:unknown [Mycoplasma sp. CAG:776]|nr:unknown [Mycoplasma sp. CAG:776]